MTAIWRPIYGDFNCPGNIHLTVDELGITISRGRRALATTEWPGETIRLCEVLYVVGEPETPTLPKEIYAALTRLILDSQPRETMVLAKQFNEFYDAKDTIRQWLENVEKEQEK